MIPAFVADRIPPAVRARGSAYVAEGRVEVLAAEPEYLAALVHGTEPYSVDVSWVDGEFDAECSCPYADDHPGACKHVWAVLAVADAAGLLPWNELLPPRGGRGGRPPRPPVRSGQVGRPPTRAWRTELQAIARQTPPRRAPRATPATWPDDRRLVYLIDLAASRLRGQLAVEVATERRRKDGAWDRPVAFRLGRDVWAAVPDPRDRALMLMLVGTRPDAGPSYGTVPGYVAPDPTPTRFVLARASLGETLAALCATGRCRVRDDDGTVRPDPLAWDDGPAWRPALRVVRVDADGRAVSDDAPAHAVRLDGVLRRQAAGDDASAELPLDRPSLLLADGLVLHGHTAARLAPEGAFALLGRLRAGPLLAATADLPLLIETLCAIPTLPPLALPGGRATVVDGVRPAPALVVRGAPKPREAGRGQLVAELQFDYDGTRVPSERRGSALYDAERARLVRRDAEVEEAAGRRLRGLGVREEHDWRTGTVRLLLPAPRLDALVRALVAEGWRVEAEGVVYRQGGTLHARVRSGVDWFDLEGAADFGGASVPFPRLLDAVRRGERTVTLDDGSRGVLPAEWLARLAPLAAFGPAGVAAAGARFTRAQAGLLDALLAALPAVDVDVAFARARDALHAFAGVAPADAPPGFRGTLRDYQREGLGWMHWLRDLGTGGCLADDMGLGKTVQVLALLEARRAAGAGPSLVVAPRSLLFNWQAEAARFAPGLRVLDHTGTKRARGAGTAALTAAADLVLTTYGTLRRDAPALRDVTFDYVVLDEAQAIKNAGTGAAKAARLLRGAHRLALSGTPVENRLDELWSLFEFLSPGLLGAGRRATEALRAAGAAGAEGEEARALVARALRPFLLRRTKAQVAPELPPRQEQTLWVTLDGPQRTLYDELRAHYRAELLARVDRDGLARTRMHVLEALLRLRQAACHPALVDPAHTDAPAAKLDVLLERVAAAVGEGHKVLVFSQFTRLLALVRARLDAAGLAYEYLDGRTRDRARRVARFQDDPACPVFLVSLKAGGTGLNLTAAEYVFLLDPWWNPAVEAQAVDRAHRIGQTRPVLATRLVARDTVEERVLALHAHKRALAEAVVSADAGGLAGIGRDELALLLG